MYFYLGLTYICLKVGRQRCLKVAPKSLDLREQMIRTAHIFVEQIVNKDSVSTNIYFNK
jgi:hypothetical protein